MPPAAKNYIAFAVPFFFLLIGIELFVAWRRGRRAYRFADAIADLGCGITQRVSLLFFEGLLLASYVGLYHRAHVFHWGRASLACWVFTFLAVDFIYYWWHRASHRIGVLWAAHVVHHQSEDYNFAVALRQAVLTPLTHAPFALPLALLGVPPLVYGTCAALNTLYQFWIHTQLVGSLGPAERALNTPSHHRVHHARNPEYIDRNYGAVFIVWDRLFGTFAAEREPPTYGITKPLASFNPLWAQVQPLAELARRSRQAPTWRDRLAVWLAPPERSFAWDHDPPPAAAGYDVHVTRGVRRYVLANLALAVVGTVVLMFVGRGLPVGARVAGAVLVLATLAVGSGLMEGRRWARPLEVGRLALVAVALVVGVGIHAAPHTGAPPRAVSAER